MVPHSSLGGCVDGRTSTAAEVQYAARDNLPARRFKLQHKRLVLFDSPAIPSSIAIGLDYELWVKVGGTHTRTKERSRIPLYQYQYQPLGNADPYEHSIPRRQKQSQLPICPVVLRCGQKAGLHCSIAALSACASWRLAFWICDHRMKWCSSISTMHTCRSL